MKIDSQYIDITINPEFQCQYATLKDNRSAELWYGGEIVLEKTGRINFGSDDAEISFDIKELEEIVRVYKLFKDRMFNLFR